MTSDILVKALYQQLFGDGAMPVYAVLDGASVPNLLHSLEQFEPDQICLYRGELGSELAEAAPYLVRLEPESAFTERVLREGWGRHWGIFVLAKADMRTLRRHFRSFLMVYDPDGRPLYFRYYDPRVLRIYLPTCNAEDGRLVFGPVSRYIMEGESPAEIIGFQLGEEGVISECVAPAGATADT